jgi:hypothetical protein
MNHVSRCRGALVALMMFLVLPVVGDEPSRVANVLIVDNDAWRTDLAIVAPQGDATVRMSDCNGFGGAYTIELTGGGGLFVPNVSQYQCSRTKLGVVKLPILKGEPRLWSQAHYRDANGNTNVVMLPTLPESLPASYADGAQTFDAEYVFEGIENSSTFGRSTFIALVPDGGGKTTVELTATSYSDPDSVRRRAVRSSTSTAVTETVEVEGFTFYELKTPVEFGRLIVRHIAPANASASAPRIFAVAFIGDRNGGSPRVEVPRARFADSTD